MIAIVIYGGLNTLGSKGKDFFKHIGASGGAKTAEIFGDGYMNDLGGIEGAATISKNGAGHSKTIKVTGKIIKYGLHKRITIHK